MKPCPTKSNCPCEGNPAGNFSSESPDRDVFLGFSSGSPQITPPIGTPFDNPNGYNYCESTVSQEAADLCAAAGAVANQVDDGNPSTPGDGAANDPGNWGVALYQNDEQSCTIQCPNGGQFTYIVPAGTVTNPNPTLVDRAAASLACNNANKFLICIGDLDNKTATVGTGYFGTVILTGNFGPYHWTATTPLPAGLSLDDASAGDPTLSKTVGIIGTPTTSGAQSFTLRATDSQGNFAERTFTITVTSNVSCVSILAGLAWGAPYYSSANIGTWTGAGSTGNFSSTTVVPFVVKTMSVDIPIHNTLGTPITVQIDANTTGTSAGRFGFDQFSMLQDGVQFVTGNNFIGPPDMPPPGIVENLSGQIVIAPGVTSILTLTIGLAGGVTGGVSSRAGTITLSCV